MQTELKSYSEIKDLRETRKNNDAKTKTTKYIE